MPTFIHKDSILFAPHGWLTSYFSNTSWGKFSSSSVSRMGILMLELRMLLTRPGLLPAPPSMASLSPAAREAFTLAETTSSPTPFSCSISRSLIKIFPTVSSGPNFRRSKSGRSLFVSSLSPMKESSYS